MVLQKAPGTRRKGAQLTGQGTRKKDTESVYREPCSVGFYATCDAIAKGNAQQHSGTFDKAFQI
jgi:hypothetical protein